MLQYGRVSMQRAKTIDEEKAEGKACKRASEVIRSGVKSRWRHAV